MAIDLEEFRRKLKEDLDRMTPEELDKYFPPDTTPKGWVSIEDHLPQWMAIDFEQGCSIYKVRDKDGNEFESGVCDHGVWYYEAKEAGITHWFNK